MTTVSFDIQPGEVHALLGENGAGKSTLVKMIYGLVKPDAGRMILHGAAYEPASPHAARNSGIAMVFQHFSLFEALNVAENVALGMENPPPMGTLAQRIREVSETYGLPLDPARLVGDLSAGERQRVEIIRCLLQDPNLLIMDEPTSVLTPQEVEILFETLRKLSAEGTAILYISHKLEEIRALCDAATVLRLGKVVGACTPREKSARELAEMMVGQLLHTPDRGREGDGRCGPGRQRPFGGIAKPLRHGAQGHFLRGPAGRGSGHRRGGGERTGRSSGGAVRRIDHPARHHPARASAGGRAWPQRPPQARYPLRARGTAGPCRSPGYEPDRERAPDRCDPRGPVEERLSQLG